MTNTLTYSAGKAHFLHKLSLMKAIGFPVSADASILDFGCGAGATVYSLLELGFEDVTGFDVVDYLELEKPEDRSRFCISDNNRIPLEDESFDFVISDQVFEHVVDQHHTFREIYRILKPGGQALHIFPANWQLIEPHTFVPLGGVIGSRWYYKLWSLLGVRNQFQQGLSADDVADLNAFYFIQGLRYVGNSIYRVLWSNIGYSFKFAEREYMEVSNDRRLRLIAKLLKVVPLACWLVRTFWFRVVYMQKPSVSLASIGALSKS